MRRRELLKGLVWVGAVIATERIDPAAARPALVGLGAQLAALERRHGGRLGGAMLDTGSGGRAAFGRLRARRRGNRIRRAAGNHGSSPCSKI